MTSVHHITQALNHFKQEEAKKFLKKLETEKIVLEKEIILERTKFNLRQIDVYITNKSSILIWKSEYVSELAPAMEFIFYEYNMEIPEESIKILDKLLTLAKPNYWCDSARTFLVDMVKKVIEVVMTREQYQQLETGDVPPASESMKRKQEEISQE